MKNRQSSCGIFAALLFLILSSVAPDALAIKANPAPATVEQPDGSTITIRKHGDEFFNYTTTADGYIIAQGRDGFYYYADYNKGTLNISEAKVGGAITRSSGATLTKTIPAGVAQSIVSRRRAERQPYMPLATKTVTKAGNSHPPRTLVLLVQFSDVKFTASSSAPAFNDLLNSDNYTSGGTTGSVKQYFSDNSMGEYEPEFDVVGPITLTKPLSYYGANDGDDLDINVRYMVTEACSLADSQVDFSQYDYDGDGYVDNIYIFYAGYSEASNAPSTSIWPHQWAITNNPSSPVLDGVRIFTYACSSELSGNSGNTIEGIGAFCHEFGHVLGLMDFYNSEGGDDLALGYFSLMDSGNYLNNSRTPPYLNAVEREMLGWMTIDYLDNSGEKTLESIDNNKGYRFDTANAGEYFVVENRWNSTNWDQYIGYSGLLIYHVDRSGNMVNGYTAARRWQENTINSYAPHQCMKLMAAYSGDYRPEADRGLAFFPGSRNVTSFTSATTPGSVAWSGLEVGIDITDISYDNMDGIATFTSGMPVIVIGSVSVGQTDAYISWSTKAEGVSEWLVEWKKQADTEYSSLTINEEHIHLSDEQLIPDTRYNVRICAHLGEGEYSDYAAVTFTTASMTDKIFTSIGLDKGEFVVRESLVLRTLNLPAGVESIVWKLDGVVQDELITFSAQGSYILSCEITYTENGITSTEIITRKLTVTR